MIYQRHDRNKLLQPHEIKEARLTLGMTQWEMAEMLLLSHDNGKSRVHDWETGARIISGPASQAIRFALQLHQLETTSDKGLR
jgi:DNA-binding transcriptional regulator YiaG